MKKIGLLFLLSLSIAAAPAAEKEVKLLGVASGFGVNFAIVDVGGNSPEWLRMVPLRTGQSTEGVEMGNIDAAKGTATVKVNGTERRLSMPTDWDYGSTNELDPSLPVMYFHALPLQTAIGVYADYKKRTALIHPRLGDSTFSLKINPRTEAEAVEAWEKLFRERNIATIPDGEHFEMLVPFASTNSVTPGASGLPQTNSLVPAMSISFHAAPIGLVIETYADYTHNEVVNMHDRNSLLNASVTLVQITPLSREEICYAMETLINWNNIRMAPDGEGKLKLERIPSR
jgi:hypothetical protein